MKVTLESTEDVKCINWLAVAEQIGQHARRKIADAMDRAASEIAQLEPGEVRKFTIEIGTIEISRELETNQLIADVG